MKTVNLMEGSLVQLCGCACNNDAVWEVRFTTRNKKTGTVEELAHAACKKHLYKIVDNIRKGNGKDTVIAMTQLK